MRRSSLRLLLVALLLTGCRGADAPPDAPGSPGTPNEQGPGEPPGDEVPDGELAAPPGVAGSPPPADADQYTLGPILRGKAVYDEDLKPLAGARVMEYGVDGAEPFVTKEDGRFELRLTHEGTPAVLVTKDGYIPSLQIATEESRPYFGGEFKIEMFDAAEERAIDTEEYGTPQDLSLGRVVLNFQPYGSSAGVKGEVLLEGAQGYYYDENDKPIRGELLPSPDPFAGEIVFRNLPPGEADVRITEPAGTLCKGPRHIPVPAGVSMRVYYFCQSPEDTAATAEFITKWRERGGPPE